MKKNRLSRFLLSALTMTFGVGAATMTASNVNAQEPTGDPVVLGVNLELTGPAAPYSVPAVEAFELYVEQKNAEGGVLDGRPLELLVLDNKTDTTESVSLQTRLENDGDVVAVLGPNASSVVSATKPVIEESDKPSVLPATTGDGLTLNESGEAVSNLFRTAYEDSFQGRSGAEYMYNTLGAKNVLLIVDNGLDYSLGVADAFVEQFEDLGGTITARESYESGDTDFNAIATNALGYDYDAIYIPGYYTETGLLVKALREIGVTQPIVGSDGFASDTFVELAGPQNTNDVHYTTHYDPSIGTEASNAFTAAYEEKYNKAPDTFAALGYDAIDFLVSGIEEAGTTDPVAINEALEATENFEGVTGTFSIDENHNSIKSVIMVTLENGEVVSAEAVEVEQ